MPIVPLLLGASVVTLLLLSRKKADGRGPLPPDVPIVTPTTPRPGGPGRVVVSPLPGVPTDATGTCRRGETVLLWGDPRADLYPSIPWKQNIIGTRWKCVPAYLAVPEPVRPFPIRV